MVVSNNKRKRDGKRSNYLRISKSLRIRHDNTTLRVANGRLITSHC